MNSDGEIRVNGKKQNEIYLNGRRFDIGVSNTVQVLQSLEAKNVKKIEVVTEPDIRFNNSGPIINIITSKNALDGVYLNVSANGETVPNAKAGTSFLAKKERVDLSFAYNYDLHGQRDQPIFQSITTKEKSSIFDGKGDGDWHTHILSAMASIEADTLNMIYADFHAKINVNNYCTDWIERVEGEAESLRQNKGKDTEGTLEANLIYRNYFPYDKTQENIMVGYRFTYNPDKRDYTLLYPSEGLSPVREKTDGGLYEHTLNLQKNLPFSDKQELSVGARTIYRKADINSTDNSGLSYKQSITYPYLSYIGVFKWFTAAADLNFEYEYMSMDGREGKASSTSNNFYFFPSVVVYRSVKKWNLNVSYKRELQRPTIVQLNPFFESSTNNFRSVGNPNLKCETKDVARVGASYFRKRVSMSFGVTYSRTDDAILKTQTESIDETGVIISSYDNIGEVRTFTGSVFFNWQPISSLVLKAYIDGGLYRVKSDEVNLSQKDYTFNLFGWIDYYFPKNWNAGVNVTHFKQAQSHSGQWIP